ncbi:hypothetical protein T265_10223 [Opisthorchis viverrini]|uniref:Uncharacterized protein n=1 Tax=Opisthorchis viverrini TaxID=6198 RepID=A0A074Z7A6_OPIVI|nr:hypothetical protein T265_10223 [Opisthorchis viverrini]KER21462.1 hypothetical protein T265_10223 [Opisthorchis viverrini]
MVYTAVTPFRCLAVCHRRKYEGWNITRLPKPRQEKSRCRGRFQTMDLPFNKSALQPQPSHQCQNTAGCPGARWPNWLEREFTDQKVHGLNPTSASRLPLSRLWQPGSIPALVQPSGGMAVRHRKGATAGRFFGCLGTAIQPILTAHSRPMQGMCSVGWPPSWGASWLSSYSANLLTGESGRTRLPPLDFRCLGLGNLVVSQPSCFIRVAWQLITERITQTFSTRRGASWLSSYSANLLTGESGRTRPPPLDFRCLGLGNLVVSQPSCFIRVAWQLITERITQTFSTRRGASWLSSYSANLLTGESGRTRPPPLDFRCLGLGNLVVSQPSCFIRVAWQLITERLLVSITGKRETEHTTKPWRSIVSLQLVRWDTGKGRRPRQEDE